MDYPDLPDHIPHDKTAGVCPGTIAADVYEDVGLTNTVCNECGGEFVWSKRTKSWIESAEFETMLAEANMSGAFAQL